MKILTLRENSERSELEHFLASVSDELAAAIGKKLHAYSEAGEIYMSNSLKILKPRIWGYKGTIYKLRVDCGKESARVLFCKTPGNDLVLLHGFIKRTQKTPKKDAKIAMANYEQVKGGSELHPMQLDTYLASH